MNSEGTRPSDVASWMLEPTAGLLMEDLLPRMVTWPDRDKLCEA